MYFVDEEYDLALRLYDSVDDALEPFLKLAFVFGSRYEGAHIEGVYLFLLKVFRHVAPYYALCQSLGNGGLSRSGFADEYWVVFGTS